MAERSRSRSRLPSRSTASSQFKVTTEVTGSVVAVREAAFRSKRTALREGVISWLTAEEEGAGGAEEAVAGEEDEWP